MDIQRLKEHILEGDYVAQILESIHCHHIRKHNSSTPYITCANPDGDNQSAILIYLNDYLTTLDYTRNIGNEKTDLFSLIEFFRDCSFFEAVKFVCDCIDLDYYHDFDADLPESIKLSKMILEMQNDSSVTEDDNIPVKPISEKILSYYRHTVNDMFQADGIDYETQQLFEIGYDDETNRITIPIRDEIGTLVGVKGRLFSQDVANQNKYIYLEPTPRNKILYGLNFTYQSIKEKGVCYVGEAEKSCMQLWSMGIFNSVAIGGKKISSIQIEKLTRLCVDIVFLFDKDVEKEELDQIAKRFIKEINVYAVIDTENILDEKESPTDTPKKLKILLNKCKYKLN